MLEGITIINEVPVYKYVGWMNYWWIFFLIGAGIAVLSLLFDKEFGLFNEKVIISIGILSILLMAGSFALLFVSQIFFADTYDHMEYDVLIDDTIKFNEFQEKYRICNTKGNIYTIREREE